MKTELLKDAVAIIRGIPADRLDLNDWQQHNDDAAILVEQISCGTIACAAGWLALHPDMRARGMGISYISGAPLFEGKVGYPALAHFFGINEDEAQILFGPRDQASSRRKSDREVWVERALELLKDEAQT